MNSARRMGVLVGLAVFLLATGSFFRFYWRHRKPITLRGAVIVRDSDTKKELPIADVDITAGNGLGADATKSNALGFFSLKLPGAIRRGHTLTLRFRHPAYRPLDLTEYVSDKLYIARMVPLSQPVSDQPVTKVGSLRVRYSIKAMTELNIGSAVKTFQIENTGNIPCQGQSLCSPDGKWKASIGSASLDAGADNEFRNARVSCIAGPCPFTKIDSDHFSEGGQTISVVARGWSDTTTFLLEAEVFHPMASEIVHESYPVVFGRALNFSLPASSEGVSVVADMDSKTIVFPLGPTLFLSWANCNVRANPDQTKVYRCELKRGYQFQ